MLNLHEESVTSLYSLLPAALKEKVLALPVDYFELEDKALEESAFGRSGPDKVSARLKNAFWEEYDRQVAIKGTTLDFYRITRGLFTPFRFHATWALSQVKLVWLLRQPIEYEASLKDIHEMGVQKMRALMEEEPVKDDGSFDKGKAALQFKIYQHLDSRLKGAVAQRIEQSISQKIDQRNLTIHASANAKEEAPEKPPLGMEEIDRRIAELEDKSQKLSSPVGKRVRLEVGIDTGCVRQEALEVVEEQRQRRERGVN